MNEIQGKNKEIFKITGNWGVQSKMLKDKYNQLKDTNLSIEHQEEGVMLIALQNILGKTAIQVQNIIRRLQTDISYFHKR